MNICGVLVHASPAKVSSVVAALNSMNGVEVHQTGDGGRVVVTVEDCATSTALDTMAAIHRLDGIVAASLVYHHFEPETAATGAAAIA